jgi:hypothetical protein
VGRSTGSPSSSGQDGEHSVPEKRRVASLPLQDLLYVTGGPWESFDETVETVEDQDQDEAGFGWVPPVVGLRDMQSLRASRFNPKWLGNESAAAKVTSICLSSRQPPASISMTR